MKGKYDIFISYRRIGGAQYARILQLMLQQRGYKVFLDYDELTDGVFSDHIKAAIKETPIFLLVLSNKSMHRCVNEDDWVRQEIMLAIEQKKHIVPVNPDKEFDGFPEGMPISLKEAVGSINIRTSVSDKRWGLQLICSLKIVLFQTLEKEKWRHIRTRILILQWKRFVDRIAIIVS